MVNVLLLTLAAIAVIALLWWFRRDREKDRFAAVVSSRSSTAKLCTRAELVDAGQHVPVALTLEPNQISYQNSDFDASIDMDRIDEVEYSGNLVTGGEAHGTVLRLRAHGRAIEFILDPAAAKQWTSLFPAHRLGDAVRA